MKPRLLQRISLRARTALLFAALTAMLNGPTLAQTSNQGLRSPQESPASRSPQRGTSYWTDTWRGWFFYEDPEPENLDLPPVSPQAPPQGAPKPARPPVQPAKPTKPPEVAEFERLQKALETSRQVAIMRPTEANVRHYMLLEAQVVTQASVFANVAQRVAWATPDLDPTLHGRPVNAKALEVFELQQQGQRSSSVQALARDHVLLFFFRSDCPYCHAFAPTLEAFQARYGLQVVAISVDGGTLPGFSAARRDNGIARALQVTQVPAVFLAQPFTGRITPIGFGVLSESQLLERITLVTSQPLPGTDDSVPTQTTSSEPSLSNLRFNSSSNLSFNPPPALTSRLGLGNNSLQRESAFGINNLIPPVRPLRSSP
jgi:conjugal transfer pilus assembly protein TraF